MNPTRVRRALRALHAVEHYAQSLCEELPETIRRRALMVASADAAPQNPVASLQTWLDGHRADPVLDLARALGLQPESLLTVDECLLTLILKTLRACLENDTSVAEEQQLTDRNAQRLWLEVLCRDVSLTELRAAQRTLLQHRHPERLRYFSRVWPDSGDLGPMRRAYLSLLSERRAELPVAHSVVGHVELYVNGTDGERQRLIDVDAYQGLLAQNEDLQLIPMRCGLELSVNVPPPSAATFCAQECLGSPITAGGGSPEPPIHPAPVVAQVGAAELLRPLGPQSLGVDAALQVLQDALGIELADLESPPGSAEVVPVSTSLRRALCAVTDFNALPQDSSPLALGAWMARVRTMAERSTLDLLRVRAAEVRALSPEATPEEAAVRWAALLHASALARWVEGVARLAAQLPEPLERRGELHPFHLAARAWMRDERRPRAPGGRLRRPGRRVHPGDNRFDFNPLDGAKDRLVLRTAALACKDRFALLTWAINEWSAGRALVERLTRGAGLAISSSHGVVRIHWLMAQEMHVSDATFKREVSECGRVVWSLHELNEALWRSRTPHCDEVFRVHRFCRRVAGLPAKGWPRGAAWRGSERDLMRIIELFFPPEHVPQPLAA